MDKKTKVIATMGPAISSESMLEQLINSGLNVMRINFSHAIKKDVLQWIKMLDNINQKNESYIGWMCDTKGPEIRVGKINDDNVWIEKDNQISITSEEIIGDASEFSTTYSNLYQNVSKGSKILIEDGLIELEVIDVLSYKIICKVLNSGYLKSNKGINVPNAILKMDFISKKDYDDIEFACKNNASYIAASFTRRADDVNAIRKLCQKFNRNDMQIIAKIENQEGVNNADEIIEIADGIMVARGDLGTELEPEEVPLIQLDLCKKCNKVGKPVIIATHMLDSMERNPRPTRAEVGDVARAVSDGADAIMLSGETAKGDYPLDALMMMSKIASRIETTIDHNKILKSFIDQPSTNPYDGIGISAVELASKINAKAIFCFTETGATARQISKYRPTCCVYALSQRMQTLYSLSLNWGVYATRKKSYTSLQSKYDIVNEEAKKKGVKEGEYVIVTGGHPDGSELTNFLKIHQVTY